MEMDAGRDIHCRGEVTSPLRKRTLGNIVDVTSPLQKRTLGNIMQGE